MEPHNEVFRDLVDLDEAGYVIAGENCKTRTPGVYAAGDCRTNDGASADNSSSRPEQYADLFVKQYKNKNLQIHSIKNVFEGFFVCIMLPQRYYSRQLFVPVQHDAFQEYG